ncbi:acetoin dehydrogenase dihydrolipoyllysine-residue acetyltransferase subunit [Lichenicola sp.]|uniref:acetoin dehydrogenase dihydrolipoyllysine-residue acetyltransferase subunit n=1 Tax=Lichenicola sp. TaxID=2804529 RepID=UPI003B006F84
MIAEFTLPRLGETMETGRVSAWLKQPGEAFRRGETLVEIESDKTVVEMPALADGVLAEILVDAGEDADVGAVLCRYEDGREGAAATPPEPEPEPEAAPATASFPAAAAVAVEVHEAAHQAAPLGSVRATPLARRLARQQGIELAGLVGSGRRGRIEAVDVQPTTSAAAPGGRLERRDWGPANASNTRIVLLHGLAADVQSWSVLASSLARAGRTLTAIDLPGHGNTTMAVSGIDDAADAVSKFLETLGDEPVELVGHSLGGAIAVRAARRVPARVRRLTLLAPAGLDRAIDVDFIRSTVRARTGGALQHLLRRLVVRPTALTPVQLDALAAELSRGRLIALADALVDDGGQQIDITGDLRALDVPVRIVWGVQDRIIPWTQVVQAGSRCAIHLIQDAGHVPHWDQPGEVAALFT